jgi:hypothetical protein
MSSRADRLREAASRATDDREELPEAGARSGVQAGEFRVGHTMTQVDKARAETREQHAGDAPDAAAKEVGAAQVQEKVNEEQRQGFFGSVPDDTPNDHYSVKGVTRGKPTPEAPTPPVKQ